MPRFRSADRLGPSPADPRRRWAAANQRRFWVAADARRLRGAMAAAVAGVAALVVVFLSPWGPRMVDLEVYRAGARALITGGDLYAVTGASTGLPFTYPIFAAVVFAPFAVVPVAVARAAMTVLSMLALLVVCHLTLRQTLRRSDLGVFGWSVPVALVTVSAHPVLDTLLFGQVNLVLMAMVLADVLVVTGRWRGVLVGLAAGIKLTPGLFVLYYLVTGQRREARTAALTASATVLLGFLLSPSAAWAFWTRHMLNPARTGNVIYAGNQSVLAISARLLRVEHPPAALTLGLAGVVVVAGLVLAARAQRRGEPLTGLCAVAVAALLASPISWTHHWVWFIPCVAVVAAGTYRAAEDPRRGRWWQWRWWVLGLAALTVWSGPMRFTPKNQGYELHDSHLEQLVANSFGLLAVAFLVWVAVRTRRAAWPGLRTYGIVTYDPVGKLVTEEAP